MIIKRSSVVFMRSGNSIRLKSELLISLLLMRYPYLLKYGMVACFGTSPAPNKYLISNLQTMSKAQNYISFPA
jgi:hypothetical protein